MTKKEAINLLQGAILDITEEVRSDIIDEYLYTSYKVKVVDAEDLLFLELNIDLKEIHSWNGSNGLKQVVENQICNFNGYGLPGITFVK